MQGNQDRENSSFGRQKGSGRPFIQPSDLPGRLKAISIVNIVLGLLGIASSLGVFMDPKIKKGLLKQLSGHFSRPQVPAEKIILALAWTNLIFFGLLLVVAAGILLKREIFRKIGVYYALIAAVLTGFGISSAVSSVDRVFNLLFFIWLVYMFFTFTRSDLNKVFK